MSLRNSDERQTFYLVSGDCATASPAGETMRSAADLRIDPGTGPRDRLMWANVARATSILLVVLFHLDWMHYMRLEWEISLPVRGAWREVHFLFTPVRMPLFFAISGMLAAAALHRRWTEVAWRRVVFPYYVYVLWILLSIPIYVPCCHRPFRTS